MKNITTSILRQVLGYITFAVVAGFTYAEGDVWCNIKPRTHLLEPGSTLNLTCSSRSENANLIWSKDGIKIAGDVISVEGSRVRSLVHFIHNASEADSGGYECQEQGGGSHTVCTWRLDVFAAPSIKALNNLNSEILVGTTTFITCKASGYPSPTYRWYFNGQEVKQNAGTSHLNSLTIENSRSESHLKISYAEINDGGRYTCTAHNSRGQDKKSANLRVRLNPNPVVSTRKFIVFNSRGQDIDLRCNASDIFKKATTVDWYHKGSKMFGHKDQFFANNNVTSILTVHNVSDEDVGIYWCWVKVYDITRKGSTTLVLAKEGLPLVSTEKPLVRTRLGQRLTLFCTVKYPKYDKVTTSWTSNGSILNSRYSSSHYTPKKTRENNIEMLTFSLTIKNFTLDDVGEFRCKADTKTGANSTSIVVQIQQQTGQQNRFSNSSHLSTSSLVIMFLVVALGSIFGILAAVTIRYLYKNKLTRRRRRKYDYSCPDEYNYDTFVTFSNKDYDWITAKLIPLLEKHTFKYCISRMDYEIGKAMIDNMAESVYQSRTVIAILSTNYMASKHCQQELDLALYRSAEMDDGSLIVIRIDSIEKRQLPKALRNRTFLDYTDKEERKHWERRLLKCLFSHRKSNTKSTKTDS